MAAQEFKTFWDIEKEKTWRIYVLFTILILLYFCPVFVLWSLVKFFIDIRQSLYRAGSSFKFFGLDTLVVLIVAAVAAGIHWYYSNKGVVSNVLRLLGAKYPDKRDKYHYMFQNVVDEIETAAGGFKVERYVLPTGAMNAFALADLNGRYVIGITEGLLSRLNREELQSVVAHEMSHIVSGDCLQTTITCSLFSVYSEALAHFNQALSHQGFKPVPTIAGAAQQNVATVGLLSFPALLLLFVTNILGQLLNMFISREKEYRADASAVRFTRNPVSLASALYKIGTHWRGAGYGGEYIAAIFVFNPSPQKFDEQEDFFATLFSTHPPLLKRLQVILQLAHADLADIVHHMKEGKSPKTEVEVIKPAFRFHAHHQDKWHGPYTILQLQSLEWLKPETRLHLLDHDEVFQAEEIPALSYFFQQRNDPIWKIRRLCPDCHKWLIVQSYEGLYVWRCAFCDGLLVEGDKLPRVFVRREKGFNERVQRLAAVMSAEAEKKHPRFNILLSLSYPRRCPKCGQDMVHKFYSYAYHVEIDECQHCRLIWFDADELEILQCLIEME